MNVNDIYRPTKKRRLLEWLSDSPMELIKAMEKLSRKSVPVLRRLLSRNTSNALYHSAHIQHTHTAHRY